MSANALVIAGNRVLRVANDVLTDSRYRARVYDLPAQMSFGERRDKAGETLVFVEDGLLELMIGGASGYLSRGEFARIAAGVAYAFRNPGTETARVLTLPVVPVEPAPSAASITVAIAAA